MYINCRASMLELLKDIRINADRYSASETEEITPEQDVTIDQAEEKINEMLGNEIHLYTVETQPEGNLLVCWHCEGEETPIAALPMPQFPQTETEFANTLEAVVEWAEMNNGVEFKAPTTELSIEDEEINL